MYVNPLESVCAVSAFKFFLITYFIGIITEKHWSMFDRIPRGAATLAVNVLEGSE